MKKEINNSVNQTLKKRISEDLRSKANDFLNSRRNANNLVDILTVLKKNIELNDSVIAPLLTLEVVFVELLKRKEMCLNKDKKKVTENSEAEHTYTTWLRERYEEAFEFIFSAYSHSKPNEACQALVTSMKLLAAEAKYPLGKGDTNRFPKYRLRKVLQHLITEKKHQGALLQRFKEFAEYFDILYYAWKIIPFMIDPKVLKKKQIALNLLELLNVLHVKQADISNKDELKLLCLDQQYINEDCYNYIHIRKNIEKSWNNLMKWDTDLDEAVHKQLLIVLLERIMPHLDKPVLLTDFLMNSLDCGGPISLLALQGIFTLIQKHNITYPNVYEKLYSLFEPEVFHMKFKARLFYLADIFLSSTHLPLNLVAAFAKRLARLSLVAPPQDAIIITQFVGNLILRHPGLKRLISAPAPTEVSQDPFLMDEADPNMSKAIESSLWEFVILQKHAVPAVAIAAKFISQSLPAKEWDLSNVLDTKDEEIFNQEVTKKSKMFALTYERPQNLSLPNNEQVTKLWKLF